MACWGVRQGPFQVGGADGRILADLDERLMRALSQGDGGAEAAIGVAVLIGMTGVSQKKTIVTARFEEFGVEVFHAGTPASPGCPEWLR